MGGLKWAAEGTAGGSRRQRRVSQHASEDSQSSQPARTRQQVAQALWLEAQLLQRLPAVDVAGRAHRRNVRVLGEHLRGRVIEWRGRREQAVSQQLGACHSADVRVLGEHLQPQSSAISACSAAARARSWPPPAARQSEQPGASSRRVRAVEFGAAERPPLALLSTGHSYCPASFLW